MSKSCLRCDWQGETRESACPNCGARPLFVADRSPDQEAGPPAQAHPPKRGPEEASTPHTGSSDTPSLADPVESSGRSPRSVAAFVLAGLVLTIAVGTWLNRGEERSGAAVSTNRPVSSTPIVDGSPTPAVSPSPSPVASPSSPGSVGRIRRLRIGTQSLTVDGVPFSFDVPARGWQMYRNLYISKSTVGTEGAEAIIYWTAVFESDNASWCGQWWGAPDGSASDYAASAARARGIDLVTGPWDVTLGGVAATHVAFIVRKDVGCNPGFFYRWPAVDEGPSWISTEVGDTIRVWVLDVGGKRLFIEGDTHRNATPHLRREIQRIVESISFD